MKNLNRFELRVHIAFIMLLILLLTHGARAEFRTTVGLEVNYSEMSRDPRVPTAKEFNASVSPMLAYGYAMQYVDANVVLFTNYDQIATLQLNGRYEIADSLTLKAGGSLGLHKDKVGFGSGGFGSQLGFEVQRDGFFIDVQLKQLRTEGKHGAFTMSETLNSVSVGLGFPF